MVGGPWAAATFSWSGAPQCRREMRPAVGRCTRSLGPACRRGQGPCCAGREAAQQQGGALAWPCQETARGGSSCFISYLPRN